ncbi:MAG TPA: alginate lyase family protein [Polyangia bacterium]|nr:alginate lyase family protein [Polyangia bacterium]
MLRLRACRVALLACGALACSSSAGSKSGTGGAATGGAATGVAGADGGAPGGGGPGGAPPVFVHPGLLHGDADFARMKAKVDAGAEPWLSGWQKLTANAHAQLTWTARPVAMVYRGADGTHPENYAQLFNDAAAAYALAVRWKVSGDARYADKAAEILDDWAAVLVGIGGTSDKFLAAGLYGYQLANAAEILRTYEGWPAASFARFKAMMLAVFYPMSHDFLLHHNGACISHYWANWDLCNMDAVLAIGVLVDDRAVYDEAVTYFKTGAGNGAIANAVVTIQPGGLGQWQESGRDQGHNTLGIGLMGAFCEMAWKQGDDLYGYDDNRFLAGAEYVAKYNLGEDVPYTTYDNCDKVNQTVISPTGRGDVRPIWELVYNHYVNRRHLPAPYSAAYAALVRPEGGGGDYGPNSGGYDQLGYGTLTATLDPAAP